MDLMKSDVKHPIGNVGAVPTNPGAEQPVMPEMTNTGMKQVSPSGQDMAKGPGAKKGMI